MDTNETINTKKLEVLRYEIRKRKYFAEKEQVYIIRMRTITRYKTLIQLIRTCMQEKIKQYFLADNEFIILPADPPNEIIPKTKVEFIEL